MTVQYDSIGSLTNWIQNTSPELKRDYLKNKIEHSGIYRVKPGTINLIGKAPNTYYTWQLYLRRCLFEPKFVYTAADLLLSQLPNVPRQFAAVEDAGLPLAQALATLSGSNWISVKKQRKQYGLLNWTEGVVNGAPLVLVDDLAGSQASLKNARYVLEAFKLNVAPYYMTLMNKTKGTHHSNYLDDIKLVSLFTCDDFAMSWQEYIDRYRCEPDFGRIY